MIPKSMFYPSIASEKVEQSSLTYAIKGDRIAGKVYGIEAIKQAVGLILQTERFEHIIYSWDYGVEISNLIGRSTSFIYPELQRTIVEAVRCDNRITGADEFKFNKVGRKVHVSFKVYTVLGDFEVEKEVII